MNLGDTLAGRFELREAIGRGGMGQVFRAADLATGRTVAVKCMTLLDDSLVERFGREARVLASLSHPAIVGYVAHGTTEGGPPFLAMDWLDGPDLARVLARGPLGVEPCVAVIRRVAQALVAAHQGGIVHRDLKPANIILAGGTPAGATVVDFGIARQEGLTRGLTGTGAMVGTVGYMAPEQLGNAKGVDARVDLFALGCVAYECLTGQPAFGGESFGAVIARIMTGQSARVRESHPGVPAALDELVASLLRTDREQRPPSAAAVLSALDAIVTTPTAVHADTLLAGATTPALQVERRPVAIVLAWAAPSDAAAAAPPEQGAPAARTARAIARRWGGELTELDGGLLLLFSQGHTVQERVARAARAALDLSDALPGWGASLSLTHAESSGGLVRSRAAAPAERSPRPTTQLGRGVGLDANALAFLGEEFVVEPIGTERVLRAFAPQRDEPRKVLGRNAPCLGRDKEIRLLESTLDECLDEGTPRAVVLRAPPGVGKSRVRRELVARCAGRDGVTVLVARCDVGAQSAALGTLRAWGQQAFGLAEGDAAGRWALLSERALPVLRAGVRARGSLDTALEFLAELVGVEVPEPSLLLTEARTDARTMRQELQAALAAWLRGASLAGALVLVLEDLHWADPSSLSLLVSAWSELGDVPLFLLATAWPEAETLHPAFFALKNAQVIDLAPLGKRTSERLARQLLGEEVPAELAARVADLADGNAFLLEEIVRHVAAGRPISSLPGSAVAMVQARLAALPNDARRLLRAASVLGERFAPEALRAVGGAGPDTQAVGSALDRLRHDELVLSPADLGEGGAEWAFRHSLVRQAAYEMLADEDRVAAHRAAAQYLSTRSGVDPAMVGGHFEKARDLDAATPWLHRALLELEELGDFAGVMALAGRIEREGLDPEVRVDVAIYRMQAALYAGQTEGIQRAVQHALDLLDSGQIPRGTPGWAMLVAGRIYVCVHLQVPGDVPALFEELRAAGVTPTPSFGGLMMLAVLCVSMSHVGRMEEARHACRLLDAMCAHPSAPPAWLAIRDSFATWVMAVDDDPQALADQRRGVRAALQHCSPSRRQLVVQSAPTLLAEFGAVSEARAGIEEFRRSLPEGFILDDFLLHGQSQVAVIGDPPADVRSLLEARRSPEMRHIDLWMRGNCVASAALASPGDLELGRRTVELLAPLAEECGPMRFQRCTVLALLAQVALAAGDPGRALAATDEILALGAPLMPAARTRFHLCRVRALAALGRGAEAAEETRLAQARVRRFAEGLPPADRENWLALRLVADTLALRAW